SLLSCLAVSSIAFSALKTNSVITGKPVPVRDIMAESLSRGKTICAVVGDMIRAGENTGEVVENAILLGHPACVVVRCAVEAGGQLEDIVTAAFRVGANSDVIVTCSIDGGAQSAALAGIIERLCLPGLGYTPPVSGRPYVPTFVSTLGGAATASPFRP
ncbi:MAG TPA: hypothetical protein VN328_04865, partial [Thermodesulfovibrionales bacterium]|nr:hypothetical protein [Thermodesulfovibrionales bacterium]